MNVWASNLTAALRLAIRELQEAELDAGYRTDSAMLAGWKETLRALEHGEEITVRR